MKSLLLGTLLGAIAGWATYYGATAKAIIDGKASAAWTAERRAPRGPWWQDRRPSKTDEDGIIEALFNPPKQERPELRNVETMSRRLVDGIAPVALRDGEKTGGASRIPKLTPRQVTALAKAARAPEALPLTATGAGFGLMVALWFKMLFRRRR